MNFAHKTQLEKKQLSLIYEFPVLDSKWPYDSKAYVCENPSGIRSVWTTHGGILIEISLQEVEVALESYKWIQRYTEHALELLGSNVNVEA